MYTKTQRIMKKRITTIIGAGAPLGFTYPKGINKPSTSYVTDAVRKPYNHYDKREINVVERIYQKLLKEYPASSLTISDLEKVPSASNINFEMLFHVMESYLSYERTWSGNCKNADISPFFALFTHAAEGVDYNRDDLSYIMDSFILRIMDIVNDYNQLYYKNKDKEESWYKDFFCQDSVKLDVFNFNYDTTIEDSMEEYEDGFEPMNDFSDVERFNPQKLWKNERKLSTINHIHGCIRYFYPGIWHYVDNIYTIHDLFKYKDYYTVKQMMLGHGQSKPTAQDHSEYYGGPIITGLRKTDKLNCIPYDFYHGHLYNCLMQNEALIIIGYSFGDFYMNNLSDRMDLLHGANKKVVLIDCWDEQEIRDNRFEHYLDYKVPSNMSSFMMRMSGTNTVYALAKELKYKNTDTPMYAGNLMVLSGGFKQAVSHKDEIYNFVGCSF